MGVSKSNDMIKSSSCLILLGDINFISTWDVSVIELCPWMISDNRHTPSTDNIDIGMCLLSGYTLGWYQITDKPLILIELMSPDMMRHDDDFESVQDPLYLGWGRGYLPWMGEGVPTLDRIGGTYLEWERGYLPQIGEGVPDLDGEGVPILDGGRVSALDRGRGTYLGRGEGIPTLNRLCHRQYTSCSFPREDFLFIHYSTKNVSELINIFMLNCFEISTKKC